MNVTKSALSNFTQRFITHWQNQHNTAPKSADLHGLPSPCIVKTVDLEVYWQPVTMEDNRDLHIVEQVVGITIRPELQAFYSSQYAGDMSAYFNDNVLSLIQPWSDDDIERLHKNLIAHLSMQKKLKRKPTLFIASTDDDTQIISVDNLSGEVILEDLISAENILLADSLVTFLDQLTLIKSIS